MRAVPRALAGLAIASLLTLPAAVVAAQSDCFTGTLELNAPTDADAQAVHAWLASDPRLSGDAVSIGATSLYEPETEDAAYVEDDAGLYEIRNRDGTWRCAERAAGGPEPDVDSYTMVFRGSGDYEGLTAHVSIDWNTYPFAFTGVILDGELPADPTLAG